MPFDGTEATPAMNRARLVDALRNDTEWEWNFCSSAGCAIGMARAIWGKDAGLHDVLGIGGQPYADIFGFINVSMNIERGRPHEWSDFYGMPRTAVTPGMVADALERVG